ncbi:MAG: hypothetical protein IJB70_02130 [Clostridia bacterium]|nr:hypothetical protein [Clostridia bacterium]
MKAKKLLSVILSLALIISCFASLSIVNVSAHQNYTMNTITFDETNADGSLKYATGNATTTGTYKNINQNYGAGTFSAYHNQKYYYNDVAEAPDNRYGKSLLIRETYETGASTQYVQTTLNPSQTLYTTVNAKASLYTKKNANDAYIQRAVYFRTTVIGSQYDNKVPVLFNHEYKSIRVFGKDTGKTFKTDVWYDIDINYNIQNKQYHVVIYEDGVEYVNVKGTDTGTTMRDVDSMILYHSACDATRNDQTIYWDNVSINSGDKVYTTPDNSKTVLDFDGFDFGTNNAMPTGLSGTWIAGRNGSTGTKAPISTLESTDDGNGGNALKFVAHIKPSDSTYDDYYYVYPTLKFTPSSNGTVAARYQISFSINLVNSHVIQLINDQFGTGAPIFYAYSNTLKLMGNTIPTTTLKLGDHRSAWFDFDVKMDDATGYYTASFVKRDDPTVRADVSGYSDSVKTLCGSTGKYFTFQQNCGTTCEHYVIFDDMYFGELKDWEEPEIVIDNLTATATAEAEGSAIAQIPFAALNSGHAINATLTVTGAASVLNLGNVAIDISALEAGTYPVAIQVLNGTTPTATVKIGETDYPVTLAAVPTSIGVAAPAGEGNVVSLTNAEYDIIRNFEITSEQVFKNAELEDDVTIAFTNPLADSVTAENFVVYKPTGALNDAAKVADVDVAIAADRKSVTISFAKENSKHYHIAINEVADKFGFTLTDYVEVNTTALPYVGDVTVSVEGDTATATFISHKTAAEVFFAIALYSGDELVSVVPANITLSADDADKDYTVSIEAPADGVTYKVKAFRWNKANQAPFENANAPETTIMVPAA